MIEARAADRAEQDRVRAPRRCDRFGRQRRAVRGDRRGADRAPTNVRLGESGVEHALRGGGDFGTDAVTGQDGYCASKPASQARTAAIFEARYGKKPPPSDERLAQLVELERDRRAAVEPHRLVVDVDRDRLRGGERGSSAGSMMTGTIALL